MSIVFANQILGENSRLKENSLKKKLLNFFALSDCFRYETLYLISVRFPACFINRK